MEENIFKWNNWQRLISRIDKQLMQLNNKTDNSIKQMGRRPKQTLLQRIYTDGQQTHEKMRIITHY